MYDGNQVTYLYHYCLTLNILNKLVTALIGFAVTLEWYIILSILMIVYVVCDYTIPDKVLT